MLIDVMQVYTFMIFICDSRHMLMNSLISLPKCKDSSIFSRISGKCETEMLSELLRVSIVGGTIHGGSAGSTKASCR